ncbi:MAG: FecR domain-containing protein [Rhodopirellula sp.]|nr:FecR domain-containing protein [Rhodopirellula sp.]
MSQPNRFEELWTDYLEGELDESGIAELRELLASDEALLKQAADQFQTHRLLGLIAAEEVERHEQFVSETLDRLPTDGESFVSGVMHEVGQCDRQPAAHQHQQRRRPVLRSLTAIAGLILFGLIFRPLFWPDPNQNNPTEEAVHIASQSHARFFGELSPPEGSALSRQRDYVLMSGLVELEFPTGASAIIEGPAVFRVVSDESLALDMGRCSVHAPDGAEGFRIETPVTRVVDRGTRFTVNVSETSETEVQVIEGAADIYERVEGPRGCSDSHAVSEVVNDTAVRLTANNAQKFANVGEFSSDAIPFDATSYRRQLPDRVVSYKATTGPDGDADRLISVTVQREGVVSEIPVDDLIPVEVTAFRGLSGAFLCSNKALPGHRRDTTSDHSLVTGVINPGGSEVPLTTDPDADTPGMAIRFQKPVVNGPDADIVLFDVQTFSNSPDGDAFHISPMTFRPGLRAHTIRKFDLTMESPLALDLTDFDVFFFGQPANSLAELESTDCTPRRQVVKFRGLAVGIDLSDLGYSLGDRVEELFIQDALDDQHFIDPVFIGGLPESH